MFASASGLGLEPATLDGTQYLLAEKLYGKLSSMSKLEGDFRRLLAQGKDPNAITLEGARLTNENRMTQSEAAFRRALKLGGESFAYRWIAQRGLGFVLYTRDPKSEEALRLFEEVYTTHPAQVAPWLIQMYGSTNPERTRDLFFLMALYKEPAAYEKLADYELGMAWEAPNESQKREHELWAAEFQRLRSLGGRSKLA
jgi:tetratricopeptide (TPR) repeat protein